MKSIFESNFEGFKEYPTLENNLETEAAVVGGGAAGLLCAYWLNSEGYKVTVFEAGRIAAGTTAKSTATLTALQSIMYGELIKKNKHIGDYFEAQRDALEIYKQIIDKHNIECDFETKPAYLYASDMKGQKELLKEYKAMKNFTDSVEYTKS